MPGGGIEQDDLDLLDDLFLPQCIALPGDFLHPALQVCYRVLEVRHPLAVLRHQRGIEHLMQGSKKVVISQVSKQNRRRQGE